MEKLQPARFALLQSQCRAWIPAEIQLPVSTAFPGKAILVIPGNTRSFAATTPARKFLGHSVKALISFIPLTSSEMWLNLFSVTSAQFVPLIERLDVTYFPKDCLQSASKNKLPSFLIGYISKSCPRCTWAVFSMCHSFLLSWHFHLVISDRLRQAKRSRCTCAWCVPPESQGTSEAPTYPQVNPYSKEITGFMSSKKMGKNTPNKDRWTYMNYIICLSTECIPNFKLITHQHLFLVHCLKKSRDQKPLRKYPH